ncbi:hypothetical protein ACFQ1E_07055 [Sphingomonas canadensis]|uniref:Uncharacterized protein n=1 Tax=Sphingomonas canadensis TaxID=1219257 RepID=A0ABW3H5Y9_9SPHN|nr:hypothetical protein [Sphingomonas canadensis]MCW3835454.1 hypothetical protein [Sphingomonas canadensis]
MLVRVRPGAPFAVKTTNRGRRGNLQAGGGLCQVRLHPFNLDFVFVYNDILDNGVHETALELNVGAQQQIAHFCRLLGRLGARQRAN